MTSKIVVTGDFEALKSCLEVEFGTQNLRFFMCDDFLIENAREVVAQAYIAENHEKLLVIMARSFRVEAQNALLKIIEEPPRNVKFLLACEAKNLLLPTIRSRLPIENLAQNLSRISVNLDIAHLDLREIYRFLDECAEAERTDKMGRNELKGVISAIVMKAIEVGFKFSSDELEYFFGLVRLADLNAKSPQLLTPLLLTILQKGRP